MSHPTTAPGPHDHPMATLAPRLLQLRQDRELTQTELGVRLGLAPASAKVQIARWEAGDRTPSLGRLWQLARALKVAPSELLQPVAVDGKP